MSLVITLIMGTLYGLLIGIIPAVGATTGLVVLFSFITFFSDPYLAVVFCMATVAASTTGDTYAGILLGIPGANSSAATMVDGFPLAQQGKATYAITAAITTSTVNGLIWGTLTFALLPWYAQLIMILGIPELWAFTVLAMATVGFVSSKYWVRSLIAIIIGITLGLIGQDPITATDRYTMGWNYLGDGIQLMPLIAGLFAVPEMIKLLTSKQEKCIIDYRDQVKEGVLVVFKHRWDALRGGLIGAIIGLLPGLGGAMADWLAYGSTVASHPKESFGNGNIKGVIGPEGANNAQKATSMIPTVLFGIPGAPFAAILLALFMYLGFELGTPDLVEDMKFFNSLTIGFMGATILVYMVCMFSTQHIAKLVNAPKIVYIPVLFMFIVWACVQYTGGWEDYVMLGICSLLGISMAKFKFSRPALVIGFILADRIDALSIQLNTLYTIEQLVTRPLFIILVILILATSYFGVFNRNKLEYT
jgi:TctA family transporter